MNKKSLLIIIFSALLVLTMIPANVEATADTFYFIGEIWGEPELEQCMHLWPFPTRDYIVATCEGNYYINFISVSPYESPPTLVSYIKTEQFPRYGYVPEDNENYCFVGVWDTANLTANLTVIDVTDINNPSIYSNLLMTGWTPGGLKYVQSIKTVFMPGYWGGGRLTAVDVTDFANPFEISNVSVSGEVHGIWVNETRAVLLASQVSKIYLYDVSDTSNMVLLDTYTAGYLNKCYDIAGTDDGIMCITSQDYGVSIFNISTDNFVHNYNNDYGSNLCTNVVLSENESIMFVGTHSPSGVRPATVYAYDITNPSSPSVLDTVTYGDEGCRIRNNQVDASTVKGNYYYHGSYSYTVADGGISAFRFGDIIIPPTPPEDTSTYRITSISSQQNNTKISNPFIYIIGLKGISEIQYYHIQISNSSLFSFPFLNIANIISATYPAYLWTNSTHFNFTIPNGIQSYGATPGTHYYRYKVRYKVVSE